MIVIGADPHKFALVRCGPRGDWARGRRADGGRRRRSLEDLLRWARASTADRVWAIEDCRHVSGALERFLVARGERIVRVPPKLMAGARKSARERGNRTTIDAVAVARAAIREGLDPLPVAHLDGAEFEIRLLLDHHERLVAERTR